MVYLPSFYLAVLSHSRMLRLIEEQFFSLRINNISLHESG